MGEFLARLIAEAELGMAYLVAPDVGTSAALFAAAAQPERLAGVIVGTGGAAVPIQLGEPLASSVPDPELDKYRKMDPRVIVNTAMDIIAGGIPDDIRADYLACYQGDRFVESMRYTRRYPGAGRAAAADHRFGHHHQRPPRPSRPGRQRGISRPATAHQRLGDHRRRVLRLGGRARPPRPSSTPTWATGRDPKEVAMTQAYRTLRLTTCELGVHSVVIDAPPMNLVGPELVRDLVRLFGELESDADMRVAVLESADPDYFVPHVDLTKVAEYTAEAAKAGGPGDASLGMLWHKLSETPVVTIAKLRGRARGAGSGLALACDMRFAARENAILGQIEMGAGTLPGAGGVQHLARLLGRGRAMEAILGADHFDAETAERYGWINRALPDADLDAFVTRLARRIASFPAEAVRTAKRVLNESTLPTADEVRADAGRFHRLVGSAAARHRTAALFAQGLQTRGPLELDLGDRIGKL
jgi:enoyl-CoA hydratase/carnithine racemase